jgi:predicted  nucleic acid-binding Zn-ribbon protein
MRVGPKQARMAIARDLAYEDAGDRCPKDGGCLAWVTDEELIILRCINCGWRKFSRLGKLTAAIAKIHAEAEASKSVVRIASIHRNRDEQKGGDEWEM